MNIARTISKFRLTNITKNVYRELRISSINCESTHASQPKVQEEKFDFEDLKVLERTERRKAQIQPFMKNIFVSVFDRELLAYPEILNKEETEALESRVSALETVFSDPKKTSEDRRNALKKTQMYAAPVKLTNNGLAMNFTEALTYLETISSDLRLGKEISDHWVGLQALEKGLSPDNYQQIVNDITSGENSIALCIKEKISERITQPDFRTKGELNQHGVWHVSGEKVCHQANGYFLVLSVVEGNRMKAFLIHPGAKGVTFDGNFITFRNTPATPLDEISEASLAQVLGTSRLHTAVLCRNSVKRALRTCLDFVKTKALSGKPLIDLSTIRAMIGEALLDIYASESAEYFTAGLLDGYQNPDAELEMAMCRNFISNRGIKTIINLLAIPAMEHEEECNRILNEARHLTLNGETLDSVNMFIALNGLHHAGKTLAEEIKQIRNPLLHPTFIIKKIFEDRHQVKDDPKLTLYLAEYLHPSLRQPANQLEYCVLRMRYACETLMSRHGMEVANAVTELNRLAEAASEILAMTSVLARASRSYCIGIRNAEMEMKLAACFVEKTRDKVKKLIKDIDDGEYLNLDNFVIQFGKRVVETNSTSIVEKPTAKVFW